MSRRFSRGSAAHRGAAMTEMVLVLPLLLVILSLVFFFGRLMVRAQHTQVMSRYETWRQVIEAPGPAPLNEFSSPSYTQMNVTFFGNQAAQVSHTINDNNFPDDTYGDLIEAATNASADAGALAQSLLYRPPGDEPRMSHGHREGFRVSYTTEVPLWRRMEGPIDRHSARVGHEWHFSHDWTAGPDRWEGSAQPPHHLRSLRDVFLMDFDEFLDGLDGDTNPEYGEDQGTQAPNDEVLASFLRTLYLYEPAYRGPIVFDEGEAN